MAIRPYLAMTKAEIGDFSPDFGNPAWLGCHFSPYGRGLSNLPQDLPEGSLLILDDITPIHRHDPAFISEQLKHCLETLGCSGVLLDFQRQGYPESRILAEHLTQVLPCPVCISHAYWDGMDSPVFLPPVPCDTPLAEYLVPWKGQEIWLDLASEGEILTITEKGTQVVPLPYPDLDETGFPEETLHCHYKTELREDAAIFTLWRTREDLQELLKEAEGLGVTTAVGLYQELCTKIPPR